MDYEKMSKEELDAERAKLKEQIMKLQAERDKMQKVLDKRVIDAKVKRQIDRMTDAEKEAVQIQLKGFNTGVNTGKVGAH